MRLFSLSILLMLFMPLLSLYGGEEEQNLPRSVIQAEERYNEAFEKLRQEYLKNVTRERDRFLQVIDRELSRLRLTEDDEKVADKIVKTEDEKVRAALLAVASDEVKASLVLKAKRVEVAKVGATDILGNPIEAKPVVAPGSLAIIKAEYGRSDVWVDVTKVVQENVKEGKLEMPTNHNVWGIPDPIAGKKSVRVTYTHRGKEQTVEVLEGLTLKLP